MLDYGIVGYNFPVYYARIFLFLRVFLFKFYVHMKTMANFQLAIVNQAIFLIDFN